MTEIGSGHSENLKRFIAEYKPKKIIETGTYLGLGSTTLIASCIRDLKIEHTTFYSMECNREIYVEAHKNITSKDLLKYVVLIYGLSIPKELLPHQFLIQEAIRKALRTPGVIVDHSGKVQEGSEFYSKETLCEGEDDLLGNIIKNGKLDPDFVLLDSGGHIGTIEFNYLLTLLRKPCAIALDDANHIKHFQSKKIVLSDNRFKVIYESNDHTGSVIAQFTP